MTKNLIIPLSGGTAYTNGNNSSSPTITLALTTATGSVAVNQSDGAGGWFPMVCNGEAITLDSTNTIRGIYAPVDIQIVATGTGVYLIS